MPCRVIFEFPRFFLVDEQVCPVRNCHGLFDGTGKITILKIVGDQLPFCAHLCQQITFAIGYCAEPPFKTFIFFQHGDRSGPEISDFVDQFGIHTKHEIAHRKVYIVYGIFEFGSVIVPKIFRVKNIKIVPGTYEGAFGFAHFLAINVEKTMYGYSGGQRKPCPFEHGDPEKGMKIDNVFADKMPYLAIVIPEIFENRSIFLGIIFCRCDVTYRCVEPDIKIFVCFTRDKKSKIWSVTGDVPFLKPLFEPVFQKILDFGGERRSMYKFFKSLLKIGYTKKIVIRFFHDRSVSAKRTFCRFKVGGAVVRRA